MVTLEWVKKEVRENYAKASRAGKRASLTEPRAVKARYLKRGRALQIELANGAVLRVPIKLIPSLKGVAARDAGAVEVLGRGGGLHWEALDLDLSVPALVASVFAGPT